MTAFKDTVNYDEIFPPMEWEKLPEVLRDHRLREEVLLDLQKSPLAYGEFLELPPRAREAFLEFCMGNRGLKITLDPFFKKIFTKERLERLISCILGQKVIVIGILPREGSRVSAESALMFLDVLVELEDGSLVNVEIQRIAHRFPMERAICYGSDLLVRQYGLLRSRLGKSFSYRSIRPVYVIVLVEGGSKKFDGFPETYLHRSPDELTFDSGLVEQNLQRYVFISLDIFRKLPHNEINELEAWMYFLGSDDPVHVGRVIRAFPEFMELYREIIEFRYHPEEVLGMTFAEAIGIMDDNAYKEMIEEMREEVEDLRTHVQEKDAALARLTKLLNDNGIHIEP